jgi:hypothetical protein
LHDFANASWLSDRECVTRQRTFIALRIFDAYVTSSLGLPRNLRATDTVSIQKESLYIAEPEMITAANANLEVLDILSDARESIFFTDIATPAGNSYLISAIRLHELSTKLDLWAEKYRVSTQASDKGTATSTK